MAASEEETDGTKIIGYPQFTGSDGQGLLCAGVLDTPAARVACPSTTELFLQSMAEVNSTRLSAVSPVFYHGRIECSGDEVDITECSVDVEAVTECPNGLVQQITCTSCKQQCIVYMLVSSEL